MSESTAVVSWEERLAKMAQASVATEASVAAGKFLSTKSGILSYNGAPCAGNALDVIILDAMIENQFYDSKYSSDKGRTPACFAFGRDDETMVPHPKSAKPQHHECKTCPKNKFGSADEGRGKACKNVRRLGLIPATDLTPEGVEKAEIAFLKVPVMSVAGWATYVRTVDALFHVPPLATVTNVKVVPDVKSQFRVTFDCKAKLREDLMPSLMVKYDSVVKLIDFPYTAADDDAEEEAPAERKESKSKKY